MAKKLWETKTSLDAAVEAYTVGNDPELDRRLLTYEAYGSLAHAAGLTKIGILSKSEFARVRTALATLLAKSEKFSIRREQEDIHTAVEQALTAQLGEIGAKIHTGRSRNDQVQVDLRLYLLDQLLALHELCVEAASAWAEFGESHEGTLLPGYTHLQRAMPTTVGHWAASHAEAFLENARNIESAFDQADASPLGSAAGYGAHLPLPRAYVAKLLGFSRVQRNTLRVQSARPWVEAAAVSALTLLARDVGVLASDCVLYATAEFGFLKLPDSFTTGSSIMPQKRNPDVLELTRARAALFPGWLTQVLGIGQLSSGYHRDYQLTKGPLLEAFETARQMVEMAARLPMNLGINEERMRAAVTDDMLATQRALHLVKQGVPFREAYRRIAENARATKGTAAAARGVALPDYAGAPGNSDWPGIASEERARKDWNARTSTRLHGAWKRLLRLRP